MHVRLFLSYFLSRSFRYRILFCFCGLYSPFSCSISDQEKRKGSVVHPDWAILNLSEKDIPKNKCQITKIGSNGTAYRIRFHIADAQACLNPDDPDLPNKDAKGIVEVDLSKLTEEKRELQKNLILMPNYYGYLSPKHFPKTMHAGIRHKFKEQTFDRGLPKAFLDDLEKYYKNVTNVVIIICTGEQGHLGISTGLKKALQDQKAKGMSYHIHPSLRAVAEAHNKYVKEGKKVFTFVHLCV